jgi:hypothetical protein
MATYKQVLTDAGRNLIADANAGGLLTFTAVELGVTPIIPANIPTGYPTTPGRQMAARISGLPIRSVPFQVTLPATIFPEDITSGFYMNNICVFARIGAGASSLYSVGYPVEDDGITVGGADFIGMPQPASTTEHYLRIAVVVDRATDVTCLFDPLSFDVYVANIDESIAGVPIPPDELGAGVWGRRVASPGLPGQMGSGYLLKRLVMGPNIEIEEDEDTITIGLKVLHVDLNLYVPLAFPPANMQPGDVGIPGKTLFDTIPEAVDYLMGFTIPTDVEAKIYIDGVSLDVSEVIFFNHPNGQQVSIIGADVEYRTTSSIDTTNNFLNMAVPSAGMAVGDYIRVGGLGGGDPLWYGLWPIAQIIDAANIQCAVGYQYNYPRQTIPSVNRLTQWKTILNCAASNGFQIGTNGIREIANIQMFGPGTTSPFSGIGCAGPALFRRVAAAHFSNGIISSTGNGSIAVSECAFSYCGAGVAAVSGSFLSLIPDPSVFNACTYGINIRQAGLNTNGGPNDYTVINNCTQAGLRIDTGGLGSTYGIYVGFNQAGLVASGGAFIILDTIQGEDRPSAVRSNGAGSDGGGLGALNISASNSSSVHGQMNGGTLGPTVPPNGSGVSVDNSIVLVGP